MYRDYEKHLRELDRKFQTESSTTSEGVDMGSEVITRSDSSGTGVEWYKYVLFRGYNIHFFCYRCKDL